MTSLPTRRRVSFPLLDPNRPEGVRNQMTTTWSVEIEGSTIAFRSPYHPDLPSAIRHELPSPARWDKEARVWRLPLLWETCTGVRTLANRFKAELEIGNDLRVWAQFAKAARAAVPDVDSTDVLPMTKLEAIYPHTAAAIKVRGFQTVGATFMARNRSALNADQPGLGKTIQTIAAVIESGLTGPVLVVAAPKSAAVLTWPAELAKWAPNDRVITISGSMKPAAREAAVKEAASATERVWVVTSPNYVRVRAELDDYGNYKREADGSKVLKPVREALVGLFGINWDAIIVDEAHKTLSGATGNVKKQSAQRQGLGALQLRDGGLRIALSGTPFRGKEYNIWGILNWLRPDLYRSYWRWVERHFSVYQDGYGTIIGSMKDEEAFYQELRKVMVRRTKGEVVAELPAKLYGGEPLDPTDPESPVGVWLPMEGSQLKAYLAMQRSATADLEGGELNANGVLAELTRLKQFSCSAGKLVDGNFEATLPSNKFEWLVDFLSERGISGDPEDVPTGKVIVASQFTRLLNLFRAELAKLGIKTHILTGATSEKDRIRQAEEFQGEGGPAVFLLNTNAGGASITLDAADDVVILDQTWNRDDQEQVEDRAHRISRTDHNVTIWNLLSLGSIEEGIARQTTAKDRDIKAIIDGQRGVEFIMKLLGKE